MPKILIVDDDPQICSVLEQFLRKQGHEVAVAGNGEQGLKTATVWVPDLILCDLDMPGVDGQGVVTTLRQDARLGEIPVIFLSACTERDQIRKSMNLGGDDFITKPAGLQEILATITARLERRQKQQQRLRQSLPEEAASSPAPATVLIKDQNRQQYLKLSEVKAFIACGEYANIFWGKDQHVLFRKALKQWQAELPPEQFVRVHRQAIVNLAFLDFVEKDAKGKMLIHLKDFKEVIPVSQREMAGFKRSLKAFQAATVR